MINKKQLTNLGFSDKEARVYLALLELGPSTVAEISRRAQINRTTGYDILEILASEELVGTLGKGAVLKYAAESPQKVIAYSQRKIKEAQSMLGEVKKLVPELQSIYKNKAKPIVKFYEGKAGMKQAYEDTLTSSETILGYACAEPMYESLAGFFPDYVKRRVVKRISGRMIAPNTPGIREMVKHDKEQLRESRLVPHKKFDLSIEINIYDNKVMIVSWEENLGILIESEKIAKAQKEIFKLVWDGLVKNG